MLSLIAALLVLGGPAPIEAGSAPDAHVERPSAMLPELGRQGPPPPRQEPKKPAKAKPKLLNKAQTQIRVVQYRRGEHWALRGLVLLSLGQSWHPAGAEIVLDALVSKDDRLRVYGLEALARTEPEALRSVLTTELIENLIRKQLKAKDEYLRDRILAILSAAYPACPATTKKDWERHWFAEDKTYTPTAWVAPNVEYDGKSSAGAAVDRALDLYESGLDVVICIDSTGSMQQTIDAAAAAIDDLVSVLVGVAPRFRLGLVHYKDFEDFGDGAVMLESLNKRHEKVRDRLSSLTASGGADYPERVECGLEVALNTKKMKWRRETNKLIVVIGDAPPHDDALSDAVSLARDAYEMPFGVKATIVQAKERDGRSSTKPTRPFVTACIGVGERGVGQRTRETFTEISDAGGGTYGELTSFGDSDASDQIVAHVLKLSFGAQYAEYLDAFVEVFLDYHRRGVFD